MNHTMTHREHPEIEDLAALADGLLEGEARQRLVEHLAHCEDCRFLLDETLNVLGDRSPEEELEEPPPKPAAAAGVPPARYAFLAVAALFFLVMGLRFLAPPPSTDLEKLSRALTESPQVGPDTVLPSAWGTVRSGDPTELATTSKDCRLGSLAVRFHLANVMGNRNAALQQAARLEGLLSSGGYPSGPRRQYKGLADNLRSGQPLDPEASLLAMQTLDELLLDRPAYALGQWAETLRQATRFGAMDPLGRSPVPGIVLTHSWSEDIQTELESLDADLRGTPDLPQLEERLTALISRVAR